jgi:glycosyltransferase involved in cell wall biosynthesis
LKIAVVIPCLNEQSKIADMVTKMSQYVDKVIVSDDNSTDNTIESALKAGACVVRNNGKRGFGSNTMNGIKEALKNGFDIIMTIDGDGQHYPSETWVLIAPIESGETDIVIGSRFIKNNSVIPNYRKLGIKIITLACNVGSKTKFTDAQCCFRAYKKEFFEKVAIEELDFNFSVETLIKARFMGYRMKEVPVTVLYHKQLSQNSTLNPIIHGLGVLWGTIRVRFQVEIIGNLKKLFK